MKSLTKIHVVLALTVGLFFLCISSALAQDCMCVEDAVKDQTETSTVLSKISESDYPNFLNISGLKKYSNIRYIGAINKTAGLRYYTVISKTNGTNLHATYDRDGNLKNGRLIMYNSKLPKNIYQDLVSDEYKDWTIVSNKMIVHDFNILKTEYKIQMKNGNRKQTLLFDHSGNRIKKLSRT